jgi:hypothetical protein
LAGFFVLKKLTQRHWVAELKLVFFVSLCLCVHIFAVPKKTFYEYVEIQNQHQLQ